MMPNENYWNLWLLPAGRLARLSQVDPKSWRTLRRADCTDDSLRRVLRCSNPAYSQRFRRMRCWTALPRRSGSSGRPVLIRTITTFHRVLVLLTNRSITIATVIHGGAGLFFDTIGGNEWMLSQNFQPFAVRETNAFTHVTSLQNIYSTDCQDFAGCVSPFPYLYDKANPRYVLPASLVFLQKGMAWPYNMQANFGIQHELASNLY